VDDIWQNPVKTSANTVAKPVDAVNNGDIAPVGQAVSKLSLAFVAKMLDPEEIGFLWMVCFFK
jgi:hypothetical protein